MKRYALIVLTITLGCKTTYGNESPEKNGELNRVIENRVDIKPLLYIEPLYPKDALENKVQGYCKVSFDISRTEFSKPFNIQILDCNPMDLFEDSCINAVKKWFFRAVDSLETQESEKGLIATCNFVSQ